MSDRVTIGGIAFVSDAAVPRDMLVVKQGERVVGAVCKGVVFGTADIERIRREAEL